MTTQSCIADCAVAHPAIRLCFPPPLQALRLHNMSFAGVAPWCRPWLRAAEQRCGAMGYAGADVKEAVALDSVRDRFTTTAALLELFGRPERPPPPYPVPLPPFGCPLTLPPPLHWPSVANLQLPHPADGHPRSPQRLRPPHPVAAPLGHRPGHQPPPLRRAATAAGDGGKQRSTHFLPILPFHLFPPFPLVVLLWPR